MSDEFCMGIDMASGPDETRVLIRARSMAPNIAAMVAAFELAELAGVQAFVERDVVDAALDGDDRYLVAPDFTVDPNIQRDFICPKRNRPRNDHPRRFRKK